MEKDFVPIQSIPSKEGLKTGVKIMLIIFWIVFSAFALPSLLVFYIVWNTSYPQKWHDTWKLFLYMICVLIVLAIFGMVVTSFLIAVR